MSIRLTQVSALTHGVRLARPADELVVELSSRRKTQVVTNSRFVRRDRGDLRAAHFPLQIEVPATTAFGRTHAGEATPFASQGDR